MLYEHVYDSQRTLYYHSTCLSSPTHMQCVPTEWFVWKAGLHQQKEQWACVPAISGEKCATPTGQQRTLKCCAGSWDISVKANCGGRFYSCFYFRYNLSTDGSPVLGSYYGQGSASTTWTDVGGCIGNESIITACKSTTPVTCPNTNHAGVSCSSMFY